MFPLGNAARATRWVSLGIGAISCGWSDIAILLGSKDGDQTPSLQTLLASGLCEITLRCLMMPHEIGIGPRLMSCKSEFASSITHWDPYPYILLNLLFSTQAAYAAPIIMQSQNRQA